MGGFRTIVMWYRLILLFLVFVSNNASAQIKDIVFFQNDIFKGEYSQILKQPLWVEYDVQCNVTKYSRKGLDFFDVDSIITSKDEDYEYNDWDKGHLAPAASFSCDSISLIKTFSYLNCALQNKDLNRKTWRYLEDYERKLSRLYTVHVRVNVIFDCMSFELPTGAWVPSGFEKVLFYNGVVETYYFENVAPEYKDIKKYMIIPVR